VFAISKAASLTLFALSTVPQVALCAAAPKPKLVLGIVIDQFRYDYLTRFRADYHGGLERLLTHGADFTNAFYGQVPTVTATGHSIFMSGAMPAVSGIVGNSWYDRDEKQVVTSVCDWTVRTLGGEQTPKKRECTDADPASPRRLLVTTLGDELRVAHRNSKVIGLSLKARAAILPSGHAANGAYWLDDETGNFISSTYYMEQLPDWVNTFNREKLAAKYIDRKWEGFPNWNFHSVSASREPYAKLPASPWGNELVEAFAEQAIEGEKLGQRDATDLLTVSFSSNDYVGHAVGPYAPEVRDMSIRTDQLIGKLFRLIEARVGLANTIVVLSADHGVAATPAQDKDSKVPGGYIGGDVSSVATSALDKAFGRNDWFIPDAGETSLYFNRDVLAKVASKEGKTDDAIYRVAEQALLTEPKLHVVRVYSRHQLENGVTGDFIATAESNGYFPRRSGDLFLVFEPGYVPGSHGTTHFSPYAYDRHVPVLFMGAGIKSGQYDATIQPNDITPTLANLLDIQTPSGSAGRVLTEMLLR